MVEKLEDIIVPTEWEDKDTDMVVQADLFEKAGLKPHYELE